MSSFWLEIDQMTHIKRWAIVKGPNYNNAEHTFRVMCLACRICDILHITFSSNLARATLHHDLDEIITGDCPSPVKPILKTGKMVDYLKECLESRFGRRVVHDWQKTELTSVEVNVLKLADKIDQHNEIVYNNTNSFHKFSNLRIAAGIERDIDNLVNNMFNENIFNSEWKYIIFDLMKLDDPEPVLSDE